MLSVEGDPIIWVNPGDVILYTRSSYFYTVNSEIFAGVLFLQIVLKDIFMKLKNSQLGHGLPSKQQSDFAILRGFYFHETLHIPAYAKLCKSKTLTEISILK